MVSNENVRSKEQPPSEPKMTLHKTELCRGVDAIEQLVKENGNTLLETDEYELRTLFYATESGYLGPDQA